ncbi:MAG: DNA repair and recombination protein RadA [Candidatus Heimdallarchaeota archaeon]|nr:DNA repair and recombination protein RadA [Candidatus Heimdallarchaeota archaeon]
MADEVNKNGEPKDDKRVKKATTITDLPGIGPSTESKLIEAGFSTLESIATVSIGELSSISSLGEKTVQKIIESAREALDIDFETAKSVLARRLNLPRITTGSQKLDELFGGGIETGSVTELYGEFRTGKTQIAHQLCVTVQLPVEKGGLREGDKIPKIIYIDTEGTFRPERIISMAERWSDDLDNDLLLENILHGRAYNSDHQMVMVEKMMKDYLPTENIGLLIVDSLISHFRAEYVGRGTLATRQQKLNQHIHAVLRAAEVGKLAVIVTNQVQSNPGQFFGDPTKPVGGHIVAHAAQTRVYLRKSKGEGRIARIVDSPSLPESEAVFGVTGAGIVDL